MNATTETAITVSAAITSAAVAFPFAPVSRAAKARNAAPPAKIGGSPVQKTTTRIAPTIARMSAPRERLVMRGRFCAAH
jgi:hypothetical protein